MMPAEYRAVTIAPGHMVNLRRARAQSDRPGFVTVTNRVRAPFDVKATLWDQAPVTNA